VVQIKAIEKDDLRQVAGELGEVGPPCPAPI